MHTHSPSIWCRILTRSGFLQSQIKTPSSSLPSLFQLIKPSILHFSTSPTTSTNDQGGDFPVPSANLNPSLLHDVQTITSSLDNFSTIPNEAKQRLEECKVMVSQDLVSECLARLRNDWAAAYTFFLWAGKHGYAYSVCDYHSMVAILGKFKRFDTAWSLVEEMRANSLVMPRIIIYDKKVNDAGCYTVVDSIEFDHEDKPRSTIPSTICWYCAAHDVAKAINAFHTMKRFGFSHGIEEFHDFLIALCRYKNVQDAEHLLLSNEASFPFETKSFNIVLNGWSNIIINLRESKQFWRNMDSRGICKDLISYSSMISCFSKAGNLKRRFKII